MFPISYLVYSVNYTVKRCKLLCMFSNNTKKHKVVMLAKCLVTTMHDYAQFN